MGQLNEDANNPPASGTVTQYLTEAHFPEQTNLNYTNCYKNKSYNSEFFPSFSYVYRSISHECLKGMDHSVKVARVSQKGVELNAPDTQPDYTYC